MSEDLLIPGYQPLVAATRGGAVENVHYGAIAVVDLSGRLVAGVGDVRAMTFTRSACKPFQAAPFVAAGGLEQFGFDTRETALLCASHSGEPRHLDIARAMLAKIGCSEADLQCGVHPPMAYRVQGRLPREGEVFVPAGHNCSGKHAGMLAHCRLLGADTAHYLDPDHPVQQSIRTSVAHYLGQSVASMPVGVDGCSAPNFAAPLSSIACAFAALAAGATAEGPDPVLARLRDAMTAHPGLVSGEGRSDEALMRLGAGDWVTKIGAEAVQGIGVRSRGLGIAIKVSDGSEKALHAVIVEVLRQLALLSDATGLAQFDRPALRNWRGTEVGRLLPVFTLGVCRT